MAIGGHRRIIEEEELAGLLIHFGMRRHRRAFAEARMMQIGNPAWLERRRVELIGISTLIERSERYAVVHDDIGARRVFHARTRAPTIPLGEVRALDDSSP